MVWWVSIVESEFGADHIKAWIHPVFCQWFKLLVMWLCGEYFLGNLESLVSVEHSLNTTAWLSIVAGHACSFMITVYSNFYGSFYQDNASCQKPQIILNLTTNCPQMASTVTESQSNRPPLAFSGNGKCALQTCSWQISTLLLFITAKKKSSDFIHPTWRLKANIEYRVQVSEHSHLTTQVCQIT